MSLDVQEQTARLRLIRSRGIGPSTFKRLIDRHGSAGAALEVLPVKGLITPDQVEDEFASNEKYGARFLFLGEPGYPAKLAAIPDAPPVLTIKGDCALLNRISIGVVGARNASAAGIKLTKAICRDLSEEGIVVVSGLARGIDGAAHRAALEGGTVACLAGGINVIYPYENTDIYEHIGTVGLLVSEMPFGTKPQARHFPRRNRIVSGLCDGLLVIEAARKSGSLITVRYAADQGRDVYAVPGSPLDPRAQGSNQLLKDGAVLVQSAEDILCELNNMPLLRQPVMKPNVHPAPKPASNPPEQESKIVNQSTNDILDYLTPTPIHIDEIVRLSGQPTDLVLSQFMTLELSGEIERHSGNCFSRISSKNE